jgi:uncharacterized protein
MRYEMISADCHIDLCWLSPTLFTEQASAVMRDRMPHVIDGHKGPVWVTTKGAKLGHACGMAATGLYEDGKKGIRRLTEPELRIRDQDLDGVQGEVLYGILGATGRMGDPEATVEVMRIYNEWLADFCSTHPERFAGLASIPNHPIDAAITEVERVAKRGVVRGLDIANSPDLRPLWDPYWNPLWEVLDGSGLPLHFHTIGTRLPEGLQQLVFIGSDLSRAGAEVTEEQKRHARMAYASHITGFQMNMAQILMTMIYGGVLERYPRIRMVLGESGIGWIPYVLWRMDGEWEDQFKDLSLTMAPSEYWRRQCWATYQTDPVGMKLVDQLGADKIMWGSDFPHPDGIWPDSREYVARETADLPAEVRRKIVCDNAARLYHFNTGIPRS